MDELKYIIEERKPRTDWELKKEEKKKRIKEASSLTTAQKGRRHYKKTGLSQRFEKRWDSPKKR